MVCFQMGVLLRDQYLFYFSVPCIPCILLTLGHLEMKWGG